VAPSSDCRSGHAHKHCVALLALHRVLLQSDICPEAALYWRPPDGQRSTSADHAVGGSALTAVNLSVTWQQLRGAYFPDGALDAAGGDCEWSVTVRWREGDKAKEQQQQHMLSAGLRSMLAAYVYAQV
jgi:hypothetical protein